MKSVSPFQKANRLSVCALALGLLFSCEHFAPAAVINQQPQSTNVLAGSNATFTVVAGGTAPLRYRWQFNGTNLTNGGRISGATNSTLLITAVAPGDAGGYRVVVSNSVSSVTSVVATLTVQFPPAISDIPNQRTFHGLATRMIPFTVSNVPAPVLLAGSSNPSLVPTNNIVFGGSGSNWNVTITPAGSSHGSLNHHGHHHGPERTHGQQIVFADRGRLFGSAGRLAERLLRNGLLGGLRQRRLPRFVPFRLRHQLRAPHLALSQQPRRYFHRSPNPVPKLGRDLCRLG